MASRSLGSTAGANRIGSLGCGPRCVRVSGMGAGLEHLGLERRKNLDRLEQACRSLPAADAHRDDRAFCTAALQLVERSGRKLGSGTAERVPERDGTAVDVQLG